MWETLIVEYQSVEETDALAEKWEPIGFLSRDERTIEFRNVAEPPVYGPPIPTFYVLLRRPRWSQSHE